MSVAIPVVLLLFAAFLIFYFRRKVLSLETACRHFFTDNPHPMWIYDTKTLKIISVNAAAVSCYGYSKKEFKNMAITDLRPADELERFQEDLKATPVPVRNAGIWKHRKKNGEFIYSNIISSNLAESAKNLRLIIASDVTELIYAREELKKLNTQLQKTVKRYETVSEATAEAIWEWDLATDYMEWNRGIESIFGYKRETKKAAEWLAKIHPDDAAGARANLIDVFKNKTKAWTEEYRYCCANGEYRHVLNKSIVIVDAEQQPVSIIGSMEDVTVKRRQEKELQKLSMVAQQTSNAVLITDEQGRIEWVNEAFTAITGYALEEVKNKTPQSLLHGEATDKLIEKDLEHLAKTTNKVSKEILNYRKDGTEYWVNLCLSPVWQNGKIQNTICIQTDITELKNKEERIVEQNKRLREIAFTNSHVLRAPLANILGAANLLSVDSFQNAEDAEIMQLLKASAFKLDQVINIIAKRSHELDVSLTELR